MSDKDRSAAPSPAPGDLSPHERAFYGDRARLLVPETYEELTEIVRQCENRFTPLVPTGLGAHAFAGHPPPPDVTLVSLRKLNKILRYEPGDFTIGVQAGLPLAELRQTLEANDQEVPVDFPLGDRTATAAAGLGTVGGFIARAPSGVRRARHGPLRGFVIGLHGIRSGPSRYKTGGMVVKNVAGYEIMKLLVGSLGTLGPIVEVNLKLRPLSERRLARSAVFSDVKAAWRCAHTLRDARLEPACIWVLQGDAGAELHGEAPGVDRTATKLFWLFEGHAERVAWQDAQAEALVRGCGPASLDVISGSQLDRAFDYLSDLASPGSIPRDDLGIARLAALPMDAQGLAEAVERALLELDFAVATAIDAECGIVTVRWMAVKSQQTVDQPLATLAGILGKKLATGNIAYLPPLLRRQRVAELVPDLNAVHARKLLRAFDPNGIFSPGRIIPTANA